MKDREDGNDDSSVQQEGAPKEDGTESASAGSRSVANVRSGELFMEALELGSTEQDRVEEYYAAVKDARLDSKRERSSGESVHMPKANIMLLGRTPLQHVVHHLKLIKSVRLNESLLVMPLAIVEMLFRFIDMMMEDGTLLVLFFSLLFTLMSVKLYFFLRLILRIIFSSSLFYQVFK